MVKVVWKKLEGKSYPPEKAYGSKAAGYDLFSTEEFVLKAGERHLFKTNLAVQVYVNEKWTDEFYAYSQIESCSGNSYKKGIDYLGGVIDEDYQGNIGAILLNTSNEDIEFKPGDKLAQLIIHVLPKVDEEIVLGIDEDFPTSTDRGNKGYGSTGVAG